MEDKRFECCFELEHKGIYFEVENMVESNCISIAMYNNFEVETEVCIRKDEAQRLIKLLQSYIKEIH